MTSDAKLGPLNRVSGRWSLTWILVCASAHAGCAPCYFGLGNFTVGHECTDALAGEFRAVRPHAAPELRAADPVRAAIGPVITEARHLRARTHRICLGATRETCNEQNSAPPDVAASWGSRVYA